MNIEQDNAKRLRQIERIEGAYSETTTSERLVLSELIRIQDVLQQILSVSCEREFLEAILKEPETPVQILPTGEVVAVSVLTELRTENERLREALKFYADNGNSAAIEFDDGARASEALKEPDDA